NLGEATTTFATPLVTVGETRERICLLKTCQHAMQVERDDLAAAANDLELQLEQAAKKLFAAILRMQGVTWRGLFQNDETKTRRLGEAIAIVHDLVARRVETKAKLNATRSTVNELNNI